MSTATPTDTVTPVASLTSTVQVSPTPNLTVVPTGPVWKIMENWTPANQVRAVLIDQSGNLWTGGPAGVVHWDLITNTPTVYSIREEPENTNVVALSQTSDGAIWVGTYGNGLARFDGKDWSSFTTEDGLPGNYIKDQTVTTDGELWLDLKEKEYDYEPGQKFHFGRFDGKTWIELNGANLTWIVASPNGSLVGGKASETYNPPHSGLIIYDGQTWKSLINDEQGYSLEFNPLRQEGVTAITVAPDEAIWVAILNAVFRYEKEMWVKITSPLDSGNLPQVSSMAVSVDGTAWFGFSLGAAQFVDITCGERFDSAEENGVYRYDGKTWTHFATEDGLVDNKICAIALDENGNVWFGSFDKGVSRFDGEHWTSYIIP